MTAGLPWMPLDAGYFHNPKARAAGKNGRALHLASSCWSVAHMTDGKILPTDIALLCVEAEVPKSTVATLVAVGLWEPLPEGEGWLIHDFLVHNKSRNQIEKQRSDWAEKKARQRGESPRDTQGDNTGDSHESHALRQTDRQTVRERTSYISDDDKSVTRQPEQSSVESIIAITAKAIALKDRDDPPSGYIHGIAKNLRAEQLDTVNACLADHLSLYDSALRLGADPWFAKKALNGSHQ